MEKWFAFRAYNSPTAYGFGTEQEADAYCDILNRKREINIYCHEQITDADLLDGLDSGRDTDGFRLDLALDTQADNDAWEAQRNQSLYGQ